MEREVVKIASEAGKILLEKFDNPVAGKILEKKGVNNYSIVADKEAENFILESLTKVGLEGNVVTEELGYKKIGKDTTYTYYIDPLDGTLNYSRGIKHFCVSIGVEKNKEMVFGAVYDPNHDELFTAKKGKGAFLNGKPINVNKNLEGKIISIGVEELGKVPKIVKLEVNNYAWLKRFWSTALDLCYVACKRLDAMLTPHANSWDMAAGSLLAKEAGAIVTNFKNLRWEVKYDEIVASSNKKLHDKILTVVK